MDLPAYAPLDAPWRETDSGLESPATRRRADLVIVVLTGRNPNVYYEAGMADAWDKPWIVVSQSADDVTFDIRHVRYILYEPSKQGLDRLESDLKRAITGTLPASVVPG